MDLMQEIEGDFKLALLRSKGLYSLCSMPHALMLVYIEHNQQSEVCMNQDVTHSQHSSHLQLATTAEKHHVTTDYPESNVYGYATLYLVLCTPRLFML